MERPLACDDVSRCLQRSCPIRHHGQDGHPICLDHLLTSFNPTGPELFFLYQNRDGRAAFLAFLRDQLGLQSLAGRKSLRLLLFLELRATLGSVSSGELLNICNDFLARDLSKEHIVCVSSFVRSCADLTFARLTCFLDRYDDPCSFSAIEEEFVSAFAAFDEAHRKHQLDVEVAYWIDACNAYSGGYEDAKGHPVPFSEWLALLETLPASAVSEE